MSPVVVRVLVLYSHPLMGEGLSRMLAAEPGLEVEAVDVAQLGAVDAALALSPDVVIVEEGGAINAADIVRRSTCSVVLDVDITTTTASPGSRLAQPESNCRRLTFWASSRWNRL